jgi:hypothetical protein
MTICPIVLRRSVEFAPPHDMGPPLSRALDFSSNSRTGSVKSSTGASQNSDGIVDGDHDSHHDGTNDDYTSLSFHTLEALAGESDDEESRNQHDDNNSDIMPNSSPHQHPFLTFSEPMNGRTSPGGTVYKGKGVRKYQGRYMNLPLQRFRQSHADDCMGTILESDKVHSRNRFSCDGPHQQSSNRWEGRRSRRSDASGGHEYSNSKYHSNRHENQYDYHGHRHRRKDRSRSRSPDDMGHHHRRWNRTRPMASRKRQNEIPSSFKDIRGLTQRNIK